MPQASEELRLMWGGDMGIGEDKAEEHLLACGWVVTRQWMCVPPERLILPDEWDALQFLIHEWDYGYGGPGKGIQFGEAPAMNQLTPNVKQVDIKRATYRVMHETPGHLTLGFWLNGTKCGELTLRQEERVGFFEILNRAGFQQTVG